MMNSWQPIETAPDNTDEVLAFDRSGKTSIHLGTYLNRMLQMAGDDDEQCFYTNWMHLPNAPGVENE